MTATVKSEYDAKHVCSQICDIPFDLAEQKDSNTLICGANKTGKTRFAMSIASILDNLNWRVLVFDNVGIWKNILQFPVLFSVYKNRESNAKHVKVPVPDCSTIFDLSLMLPKDQKEFVDKALETVWSQQVKNPEKYTLVVLEELQLYAKNLRGDVAQNILRIASAGRNHKVRFLGICCDLALIDCALIRLSSQRYYGRLNPEENSKRKFRSYHGGDWCKVATELDTGFFIWMLKERLKVVKVPFFNPELKPRALKTWEFRI